MVSHSYRSHTETRVPNLHKRPSQTTFTNDLQTTSTKRPSTCRNDLNP